MVGPVLSKRVNLVPWSAPVARVHPRTADHRKFPYRVRPDQGTSMAMEWGGEGDTEQGSGGAEEAVRKSGPGGNGEVRARGATTKIISRS